MESVLVVAAISALVASVWCVIRRMEADKIRTFLEQRGGRLASCKRGRPAGHWRVHYLDAGGRPHEAVCRASVVSGVYFTHDEILGGKGQPLQFIAGEGQPVSHNSASGEKSPASQVHIAEVQREVRKLRKRLEAESDTPSAPGE